MTPERRSEIVRILEESGKEFEAAVARVPGEHAGFRPEPGSWCVLEIVEHAVLAEKGMFRLLGAATPAETSLENPAKESVLAKRVVSRETRGEAPERVRPAGRFESLTEALSQFSAARENTIRFVMETEVDLFSVTAAHPLLGQVNGFELLLIMAGHPLRHAAQIAEIRDTRR